MLDTEQRIVQSGSAAGEVNISTRRFCLLTSTRHCPRIPEVCSIILSYRLTYAPR